VADYTWSIGPWVSGASAHTIWATVGGAPQMQLMNATGRKLSAKLIEPSDVSFTLPGGSAEALMIEELITDVWVYRNGVSLFRGRVLGPVQDSFDGTQQTLQVSASDYRAVLDRRIRYTDRTWSSVDQSTIAWDVITDMQADAGGNVGITKGLWPTSGVIRTSVIFTGGTQVFSGELRKLASMDNGFDFDIDASLKANLYYPARGIDNGVVLDHGGVVASWNRTFDPSSYANAIRQSGADGTTPAIATVADIATAREGRWDAQFGDVQLTSNEMVSATATANLARANLARLSTPTPSYTLKLVRGRWDGPGSLWLGDWVLVVIRAGRLNDVFSARVTQIDIEIGAGGAEDVTVYAGTSVPDQRTILRGIARRLVAIQNR
jgi:hypothetical protein